MPAPWRYARARQAARVTRPAPVTPSAHMNGNLGSAWFRIDSGRGEPAFNMALDEALLEAAPKVGRPVLRFYGWTEPAASFGYSQRFEDVAAMTPLRPLIRRCTGGGIVPHDADWTYSLVFPAGHAWYELAAIESYRRVHEWLHAGFARVGIETSVAPAAFRSAPGQCFAGHERFDLLFRDRKIAGAAQRRARWGLLIQGSVQPKPNWDRHAWERAMGTAAEEGFGTTWAAWELDANLHARAAELASLKYSREEYNRKR